MSSWTESAPVPERSDDATVLSRRPPSLRSAVAERRSPSGALVKEIDAQDLSVIDTTAPQELGRAVPADVAATIRDLMVGARSSSPPVTGRSPA